MTKCPVQAPVVDFDLMASTTKQASDQAWSEARDVAPVVWTESGGGFWLVTRYEEVCAGFRDWDKFSSARRDPSKCSISLQAGPTPMLIPEELDPPEWHPVRRVLSALMKPAFAEEMRPRVRHWANHFVDQFAQKGRCDLVQDLVVPLPASVTMELLGFPQEEWIPFASIFHEVTAYPAGHESRDEAFARFPEVLSAIRREVAERQAAPRNDFLTAIMKQQAEDGAPDPEVVEKLIFMVMGGGVDTTTSLTAGAFVHLGRDRELRRRLIEEPDLMASATEEFLRMYPPARTHARTVKGDVEFAGCQMADGDRVVLSEISANFDEREFEDPEQFKPDRFPNRHLSFGMGIHRCPGSHIARIMFTEMLSTVLRRLPDFQLDEEGLAEYPSWAMVGGWSHIPITFTPEA